MDPTTTHPEQTSNFRFLAIFNQVSQCDFFGMMSLPLPLCHANPNRSLHGVGTNSKVRISSSITCRKCNEPYCSHSGVHLGPRDTNRFDFPCVHQSKPSNKQLSIICAAPLRYELGDDHTYDFVEGIFPYELASGRCPFRQLCHGNLSDSLLEIKDLVPSTDQGFSYFDPESASASLRAVEDLESFIAREGPYDGVLAFSQGMMLACTLLMRNVEQNKPLPFKCAIFFSPRMAPLDYDDLCRGVFTEIDASKISQAIGIPTTLVWGSMDPNSTKAIELQELFQREILSTYVHDGGHEIPGYALKKGLLDTVNVIRRTTGQL